MIKAELLENLIDQILNDEDLLILTDDMKDDVTLAAIEEFCLLSLL